MASPSGANYKFKAEIQQLLEILIHSLYTNKEIFLRELVSNASDALDKYRLLALSGRASTDEAPLEIRIEADKDKKILTISDNGVGMTRDELVQNLGTIAHSGTAEFVKSLSAAKDDQKIDSIIGKFGVGFYAVFMVAHEVVVTSKSYQPGEPAQVWKSSGAGSFRVEPATGDVARGTRIEVHLKDDALDYADPARLRGTVQRHSNFVSFPVLVAGEQVNTVGALWREPKFSVTQEQYAEFYKFLTYDTEAPLETIHLSSDAPIQFSALLFVPPRESDPYGLQQGDYGPDLYVRRVLIQRQHKELLPDYLGFLRGVVDSEDLPLNISRETLQENLLLRKISQTLTKSILSHLEKLAKADPEKYTTFWKAHGKLFRLGYTDFVNREAMAELLRFNSSHHADATGLTSLADYLTRAKEGQKDIYYISGSSRASLETSPILEIFRKKGLEVLYLTEPVDEFVMDAVRTHQEHKLTPVEKVDPASLEAFPDLGEAQAAPEALSEEQQGSLGKLLERMREILGQRVTEVRASKRLKDSPVVLLDPHGQMTSSMQKIMRLMTKDDSVPAKVLEVNPDHAITRNLLVVFGRNPEDDYLRLATEQLFEAALLQDGYLTDPHSLVRHIHDHLGKSSAWYKNVL